MRTERPRVFISSTIPEFRDLRSAIRYWFEESGFEVQTFELPDFEHRPDASAFEACFDNIRASDYYVLLIGRDRGSSFDETGTTVTQNEYRVAYESFTTSQRPLVLPFVRKSVLDGIAALDSLGAVGQSELAFAQSFIREVRRDGDSNAPASLTIPFSNFRELVDGVKSVIPSARSPLARQAVLATLKHELEYNLMALVMKSRGEPFFLSWYLNRVREQITLSRDDLRGSRDLTFDQMKSAFLYLSTGISRAENFIDSALVNAMMSGALLRWNAAAGRFEEPMLLTRLYELEEELAQFKLRTSWIDDGFRRRWHDHWSSARSHEHNTTRVAGVDLVDLFGIQDTQANIERLVLSVLLHIYHDQELTSVALRHSSPIPDQQLGIDEERASLDEIREWLQSRNVVLRTALRDASPEERAVGRELSAAIETVIGRDRTQQVLRNQEATPPLTKQELSSLVDVFRERGYL